MTCGFCGLSFEIDASREACAACSAFGGGGCRFVRCPRCGYEMPEPVALPAWVRRLKSFLERSHEHDDRRRRVA